MSGYRKLETISSSVSATTRQIKPARRQNKAVLAEVLRDRNNQILLVLLTVIIGTLYTILLPFDFSQRFSLANWHYLSAYLAAWSVVLGAGMSLIIVLQVYAMRQIGKANNGTLSGLAFVGSILPSFLCCTPIIATILAFIGLSTVSVYGTTGALQHFFAVNQTAFFSGSALLLVISGWWSVRSIANADCLNDLDCNVKTALFSGSSKTILGSNDAATKGASR